MRIDLHLHSAVSDGTDSVEQLVRKAHSQGLDVIGLCDHDTFDGIEQAKAAADKVGIEVICGIEISCAVGDTSIHLLGYGCDRSNQKLNAELAHIRESRLNRIPKMCAKLTDLGMPITFAEVLAQADQAGSVGRPHVADALVAAGYVANRKEAFDNLISADNLAYVPRYATELAVAIDLVHQAGGAAVIAHPWARGADQVITAEYLATLLHQTQLDGIEVDHQEHNEIQRTQLRELANSLGLITTGASDYHGLGKTDHEMGCNTTSLTDYSKLMERITARGGVS
ncbi:MAG: phosphatase [Propionibacterium sp.]|nr:MAG: phosphatase [Propionibacterium sp.]